MKIQKIEIKNFKTYKNVVFNCNEEFNFVIGCNNVGKSTFLEAIQLWKASFDKLIQTKSKGKKFYSNNTNCYLGFQDLFFLRVKDDNDIFNDSKIKELSIKITFKYEDQLYPLNINLEKSGIPNSYFRVKYTEEAVPYFNSFRDKVIELGLNLYNAIFIYQTTPIFNSIKNEPFYNNAQLLKKISLGKSHEVIRNKILKSENSDTKFESLESRLENVFETKYKIRIKNRNRQDEEHVRLTIQEDGRKELEISLMGSGLLQILEIFSTLEFVNKYDHCVNILLIDEPDSHIHSNLQSKLFDELRNTNNNQVFLISHNDRLINKAKDGELFFLNSKSISDGIINPLPENCYSDVSNKLADDLLTLDEIERNKIIVITEGKTDKTIIDIAWTKLNPGTSCPYHVISSGLELDESRRTGNADTVRRTIELISTISTSDLKIVGLFDNDREGNEQFKGLNKKIFNSHSIELRNRKHKEKNIYGMLLPVPDFRSDFITDNITQRYFVIEHYFSNAFLEAQNMKGANILTTNVFEITGDKAGFSTNCIDLESEYFGNFSLLFDAMNQLFVTEPEAELVGINPLEGVLETQINN